MDKAYWNNLVDKLIAENLVFEDARDIVITVGRSQRVTIWVAEQQQQRQLSEWEVFKTQSSAIAFVEAWFLSHNLQLIKYEGDNHTSFVTPEHQAAWDVYCLTVPD